MSKRFAVVTSWNRQRARRELAEEFVAFMRTEIDKRSKVVKAANIRVD